MKLALQRAEVSSSAERRQSLAWFLQAALLAILFLFVDACVLKFIFPGYLDPFWPHHSDYYLPAAIAYSPASIWDLLTYPRPVGQIFFWVIGHLRTRGAMVAVLCVVAANFALLLMVVKRVFRISFDFRLILSATLFAFLLAVHPYQYQFSTWDAFTQLSLLLLLLSLFSMIGATPWWVSGLLVLLAFLAKETFIVSAGFLAFVWWVSNRCRLRYVRPMVIIGIAGVLAILAEHFASSPFTSGGQVGGPYQIVVSVESISHEWMRYAAEGMNALSLAVVLLTAIALGVFRGIKSNELLWAVALPVAGTLAWLPNSLLPYHHFEAYSFSGAYLIYLPVTFLALLLAGWLRIACAFVIAAVATGSPLFSAKAFADQNWIVMNQARQKLFLRTFGGLIKTLPGNGKTVLVSGMSFPYSMFSYRYAVRSLSMPTGTHFVVVQYDNKPVESITKKLNGAQDKVVRFISPSEVDKETFDEAWLFRDNGGLVVRMRNLSTRPHWSEGGITDLDVLKYPLLADSFGPPHQKRANSESGPDGYAYLSCGVHMIDYNNLVLAGTCLEKAVSMLPDNPYSSYWLGVAFEKQGKVNLAREAYQNSIRVQANSPNPAFQQALDRLH
ncbi:tetratricopeptide repeat protein [Paraburkholderia sp. SIMBA_054]|uniref:tetratricopeptide repeat protein n=1 Tax=Paraburkholderia sp. SIMBA_054 TaxID=3085795 RepID=UPI00397929A6